MAFILCLFLGTIDAFDMPARMAFMPELVGKEALHSAVSLNSTNFNITRIVGPLLAAFLLNYLSYSDIFFLNAVSLIPILFAYAKMNVNTPVIQETNKNRFMKSARVFPRHERIRLFSAIFWQPES